MYWLIYWVFIYWVYCYICVFIYCWIAGFIYWLIGWLVDWFIDYCWIGWFIDWLIDWLVDWLIDWLIDCWLIVVVDLVDWSYLFIRWLIDWLIDWWWWLVVSLINKINQWSLLSQNIQSEPCGTWLATTCCTPLHHHQQSNNGSHPAGITVNSKSSPVPFSCCSRRFQRQQRFIHRQEATLHHFEVEAQAKLLAPGGRFRTFVGFIKVHFFLSSA
jgi:hypothetical protein